jgi:hypothetical protein
MTKELTVGELKKALEGVPDDIPVKLSSDTGVDQGEGAIIVESARRVNYNSEYLGEIDYFDICANDYDNDEDEDEQED